MSESFNALSTLREDEQFFYETVRDFAREQVQPLRERMDEDARIDQGIMAQLWEMAKLLAFERHPLSCLALLTSSGLSLFSGSSFMNIEDPGF